MDKCTILVIVAVGVVGFWFGYAVDWGIWVGAAMVAFSLGYFCVAYCKKKGLCGRDKRQSQTSGEEASTDTQTTTETHTSKDIEACDEEPANLDPLYYHPSADPDYDDVVLEEVNHVSIGDVSNQTSVTSVSSIDMQETPIAKDKVKRDYCVPLRKAIEAEEGPRKTYTDPLHFHPKVEGNKTSDKGVSNQTTSEESNAVTAQEIEESSIEESIAVSTPEIPVRKETKANEPVCVPLSKAFEVDRKTYEDPLHYHPKAIPTDGNTELEEVNDGSISDLSIHWIQPHHSKKPTLENIPEKNPDPLYYDPALQMDKVVVNAYAEVDPYLAS